MLKEFFKKSPVNGYIALSILIITIFGLQTYLFQRIGGYKGDFLVHLDLAQQMLEHNGIMALTVPLHISAHSLYHILAIALSKITGFSLITTGFVIVPLLSYIALGLVVYNYLNQCTTASEDNPSSFDSILLTLCLMLVGPISFFTFPNLYLGYIGITIYHSPTQILLKPLSFITFVLLSRGMDKQKNSMLLLFGLIIASVLSLLAKPSYIICLIPAVLLFSAVRLYGQRPVNLPLIALFIIVCFIVLGWQYWLTYSPGDPDSADKIIFAPFVVMSRFSDWLFFKFMASILFPATVYLAFFSRTRTDMILNFAWLTFGVSIFYTYFLAEAGSRLYHGNFTWGSQIAIFILFVVSMRFLIEETHFKINKSLLSINQNPRLFLCLFIFLLHLLSGLLYYLNILIGRPYE